MSVPRDSSAGDHEGVGRDGGALFVQTHGGILLGGVLAKRLV